MNSLGTSIVYLKGVGPKRAEILQSELEIFTLPDLLTYFPFRYVDRTRIYTIAEIKPDMPYVQLKGIVKTIEVVQGKGRNNRMVAQFSDNTGTIELVWFTGIKWLKDMIKPQVEYIVFGKPTEYNRKMNIAHPEMEAVHQQEEKDMGLQAVYNSTEKAKRNGLDSKAIGKLIRTILEQHKTTFAETLPDTWCRKLNLISRDKALRLIHAPTDWQTLQQAQFRLKFEEFFYIQLKLLNQLGLRKRQYPGFNFEHIDNFFHQFYHHHLPFALTEAQKRVIREIRHDVLSDKQMSRLLQGDVGSGKTIVALFTMLMAIDNDYQATLLAPTEILANQHFQTLYEMVQPLGLNIRLLTGSTKKSERQIIHEELASGALHILVGTHAILEEKVVFSNLGMAVIDEQHRFGVSQRARIWQKNKQPPHILVMTATPIPRTLAMTLYGDLDVSVIDELPPGRKPIETIHRFELDRQKVYNLLDIELKKGRQVYIVYPLIEESEKLDYKNLFDGYDHIKAAFTKYQVGILHGRMPSEVKDMEMARFLKGETHIMVATTVIEVGVNVPNASVMVIENAERFGLSQLHQLRGRVGRGAEQSYCILVTPYKLSEDGRKRIDTMVRTNDGFEISEVDLQLRGPGDIDGTRQSGLLNLKIADVVKDQKTLTLARHTAQMILDQDPELTSPDNKVLLATLNQMNKGKTNWADIS